MRFFAKVTTGVQDLDLDGDGLVLAEDCDDEDSGGYGAEAAYLVLGPISGNVDLSAADAKLIGENSLDLAGSSVSGAGDVDGDGFDDILVGAWGEDSGGTGAGAAYLLTNGVF